MAEDRDKDAPSLEPPSLFGRKKKSAPPAPPPAPPAEVEPEVDAPTEPIAAEPAEPAEPTKPTEPTEPILATEPIQPMEPVPPTEVDAADDDPDTIFDDDSEPTPDRAPAVVARTQPPKAPREPWMSGRPAAILTGLLVGAVIVAATAGSLRVCTNVKGTSSCGGPGFFLLLAILIVAVLIGAVLLRAAQVPEPGSTSFLAVGLLSVVALLFLVGSIFEWWMAIVIPLVSIATFLLSHWVTTTYIDPGNDGSDPTLKPEEHDVR